MIRISSARGFTTAEMQKLQSAVDLANNKMIGVQFQAWALKNIGPEALAKIMEDCTLQFSIETPPWYKRWFSKEVAREVEGVGVIFDRNKYALEDLPSLANTVAHERCHAAGFTHPFWPGPERDASLPYRVGGEVEAEARVAA
jgi:hypothetical protein